MVQDSLIKTRTGFGSKITRYGHEDAWYRTDLSASARSYRRDTTCASSWRGSGHRAGTDQVQACGEVEYDDYGPQTDEPTRGGRLQQVVADGAAVKVTWQHHVSPLPVGVPSCGSTAQATAGH